MIFRMLTFCVMMSIPAFAGKVISYTATSMVSQEDANNAAIAGVAKQISSQVEVNQFMDKTEINGEEKSAFKQSYRAQNVVKSNVKLKGIQVSSVKAEKGFKATAQLDLDVFTADLQLKLKNIQEEISKQEEAAQKALSERHYYNVVKALEAAKPLTIQHQKILDQLGQVYPVNDTHRLHQNLSGIQSQLVDRLSKIKMNGPGESFELNSPEMPPWEIYVQDEFGPLPNFPLVAKQGRNTLSERRTQENGKATFNLRNINYNNGPYTISVEVNLPRPILREAGILNSIDVKYTVKQVRCNIQLQCKISPNACNAIEIALSQSSINNNKDGIGPKISMEYSSQARNTLGNLTSFNMNIILRGKDILFSKSTIGAGKNEMDALVKAIQKIEFSELKKQLGNHCY